MSGPSSSLGASSGSQCAPKRKRATFADLDVDALFAKAEKARKAGVKPYWKHVHTVQSDDSVFYQCNFCQKELSVKNPHDSVAKHIILDQGDPTCKVQLPVEKELASARELAAGVTLDSRFQLVH
jgi:hypothetical protein